MSIWQSVITALRALRANKMRSVLTMLGIIIGVAAVITMIAIGSGAQQKIEDQIRSLGANLLQVQPGTQREGGVRLAMGTRHTLTEDDAAAIAREISAITIAAPAVQESAQVVYGNRNWSTVIVGAVPDHLVAREWPVELGRPFTWEEVGSAAKVAVLGARVAKSLFQSEQPVGEWVRIGDVPFLVVGILSEKGQSPLGNDQDNIVFVPLSTAKLRLEGGSHKVNPRAVEYIYIKVRDARAMDEAKQQIGALLRQRHRLQPGEDDDFQVRDLASMVAAQQEAGQTLTVLLAAVASVSLLVGGISIMNIMLVSVTERTREIGLRLAVGARRLDVRNQFLIEAITLCLLGGAVGVGLGMTSTYVVSALAGWHVIIEPWAVLLAVGFATLVGIFFGFYPALKASRLDPIEALRFE